MDPSRRAFLDQAPPAGYVAGLGRGVVPDDRRMRYPNFRKAQMEKEAKEKAAQQEEKAMDLSESQFDKFSGYQEKLFSDTPYEQDDEEADAIWDSIDAHIERRRKVRREKTEQEQLEKYRKQNVKVDQQFADLKPQLTKLSDSDWAAIPDIAGDRHWRPRKKLDMMAPVSDSLIQSARMDNAYSTVAAMDVDTGSTPVGTATPMTDVQKISEARNTMMGVKLDRVGDSVSGMTNVDPLSYMSGLDSSMMLSDADVGDLKKAELLLESVIQTNPGHGPGWIAAARLQEKAGKLVQARKYIRRGCDACPDSEDVWLEAARLHTPEVAKTILAEAVQKIPKAVKIWLAAAKLESDIKIKKRILRRGLEFVPTSVKLWKEAVQLEEPADARVLLSRAVECIPDNTELWLALARLETFENAQKVLNLAREKIPTDPEIWIAASMLQEANGQEARCNMIMERAVASLANHGVVINRDQWLEAAQKAEQAGAVHTCQAIVRNTIGLGVEDLDRKRVWLDDAAQLARKGLIATARAIYAHALTFFKQKKSVWMAAAQLELQHGSYEALMEILKTAVACCPRAEVLWLMAAKEAWKAGQLDSAREIIKSAFLANEHSERIYLAAAKLEAENNETQRASVILKRARMYCPTSDRVWMKSALSARQSGNVEEEEALLKEGVEKFPTAFKLWLMYGQLKERQSNTAAAAQVYIDGLKHCPKCVPLWTSLAVVEEMLGSVTKARAVLEKARLRNPSSPQLWVASIRLEARNGNEQHAKRLLADALKECEGSGIVWVEAVALEPRAGKKAKIVDAMKKCEKDAHLVLAAAKLFWQDRLIDKARSWLNRAVQLDPMLGDAWAALFKFEVQHGDEAKQQDVVRRVTESPPKYGELWISVSKGPDGHRLGPAETLKRVAVLVG